MGPCTASSCCCQARNLPWAPVPPPHAAARSRVSHGSLYGPPIAAVSIATLCHVPLSGLLTLLVCSITVIGLLADYQGPSHCCCQAPVICHGPLCCLHRLLICCHFQVQTLPSWVPVRAASAIAAVSILSLSCAGRLLPLSGLPHCCHGFS
ncbi:unnamed protein product, partial [Staurois parvus]